MQLKQAIESFTGHFTDADQRIIKQLLAHPVSASFLSAAELASRVGVHEASAVRLAQKLGYRGYPELRAALQADLTNDAAPAERVRRSLAHAEDTTVLQSLIANEVAALQNIAEHIQQPQLDEASLVLRHARRVFVFGRGHATILVELMDRRLRRSGVDTVRLHATGRDLAEHLLTLNTADVVLAFAFHREPSDLATLLENSATVGARTIVISDTLGPLIRPRPDILLTAPRGIEGEFQSLGVPMTICNALVLTMTRLDNGASLDALNRLADLAGRFEQKRKV
jgi:DNA-binding MurR/RpiR family transcriptional regulator